MSWDCVEVGLAGGEETVSFGPRHETGSSLYQVDTLANISPREKSGGIPRVHASLSQDGFCVIVSSQVLLFNSNCTILQSTFNFENEVDTVAWSSDSAFLAIGERSGEFHFVHVPTKQILFSQELVSPQSGYNVSGTTFQAMLFTPGEVFGTYCLVILSSRGKLFYFSNLKLEELSEAIEAQCVEIIKENKEGIQLECFNTSEVHNEWVSSVTDGVFNGVPSLLSSGKGETALAVWAVNGHNSKFQLDSVDSFASEGAGFMKCCASDDGAFVIALDETNTLSLWDLQSLNMTDFWPDIQVKDFILLHVNSVQTPGGGRSDSEYKLVIITQPQGKKCYLQVYALPFMEQVYSREVSSSCYLSLSPSYQETIYFIEGLTDAVSPSDDDVITELRVRCLTEALPENRLYRLLNKQQFDAAEAFARQFQLDVELVFKVKVNFILDKVSPWNNNNNNHLTQVDREEGFSPVAELKKCFASITADSYVVNCCLQSALSTIEATFELLSYSRNRVSQTTPSASDRDKAIRSHLLKEVLEALDRFATFKMAFGTANFSGSRWQVFRGVDLLGEVNKCIERGEIASAVVIWKRHQSRFEADFTIEKLELVLGSIRQDLLSSSIIPWLRDDFIPFVVKVLPQGQEVLARWLGQRARNMELSEKEGWPANALEFASLLTSACLSVSGCSVGRGLATPAQFVNQVCGLPTIARAAMGSNVDRTIGSEENDVQRLLVLVQQLTDLLDLHTKYGCKISLFDYSQETTTNIVFRLLDKVMAAELIPSAIEKQVGPYMANHGLKRDKMLLEYVKDMFNKVAGSYSSLSNSLWEARVIAVISCIRDKEARCHSALEVMRHTLVPWSEAVETLIEEVMTNYPNNTILAEQYRLVELKKMLRQYGLRSRQVSSSTKSLIRFILTKDTPTSMEDALQVAAAFSHVSNNEVYSFRVQQLCLQDRVPECLQLLKSLPARDAAEIAQKTVTWLCGILEDRCFENDDRVQKMLATQTAIAVLRFIDNHDLTTDFNISQLQKDLRNISALQSEFGEFLSVDRYQDTEERERIFRKCLDQYLNREEKDVVEKEDMETHYSQKKRKPLTKMTLPQFLRLSELVGLTRDEARERVAFKALESDDCEAALEICRELYEKSPSVAAARTMYQVAHRLSQLLIESYNNQNKNNGLTEKIHQLLSHAVALCSNDILCDSLELCKCCSIADSVFSQCESGDYDFSVQNTAQSSRKDPLAEWSFGERFKEDGLVLDSFEALPLAGKFNLTCVPDCGPQFGQVLYPSRVSGRPSAPKAGDKKAIESGEDVPHASHLLLVSQAGLNIIRHLQENSLNELALRYAIQTIGVCLQHYSTNYLTEGVIIKKEEKKDVPENEVLEKQRASTILEMGHQIVNELIGTLFMKVFNCRTVDHDLGLGYVCSTPKQLALKKLESSGMLFSSQSYSKILAYSKVGVDFALLCDEAGILESCKALATNAAWGVKLRKVKIPFKDSMYSLNEEEKLKLLTELMKHPEVDLTLITEFCRTRLHGLNARMEADYENTYDSLRQDLAAPDIRSFKIDEDQALLMYVKVQLLPSDSPPLRAARVQDDEEDVKYQKVAAVIKFFTSNDAILQLLLQIVTQNIVLKKAQIENSFGITKKKDMKLQRVKKVDPYDYDRIRFILEQIVILSDTDIIAAEKGIQLIDYLARYDRHAPPGYYEKTYSYQGRPEEKDKMALEKDEVVLSPLSQRQLPYHHLLYGDPWKVIAPELTEETVPKLLGIAKLLKLSSDKLYVTAIKNMFESTTGATQASSVSGRRQSEEDRASAEKLKVFEFEKAKTILYAITSKDMATAAASWIAQQLPLGEEKITVLQTCVDLAKDWKTNCTSEESEKANSSYLCLLKLSRGVATEHVLHKYAIAEPSVVALVSQPAKLICQLYEKYGTRDLVANTSAADIHRATDEIAAINNSNVSKIRLHLLEKWLPSVKNTSQGSPGPNPSKNSLDGEENDDEDEKNLKRVIYLVRNSELEHSTRFLLNYAYKMSSSSITSQCRMRALRALFAIAPADTLQQVSQKPVESIRQHMQSLVYLAEFEGLHIQQSLSAFQKCNKEGLVRGLWRNHHHEKRAVRLVADLSLDNGIYDPQLWNSMLQQLLAFGMIRYLRRVLGCLAGVSELWQVPCLPHVWRSVLMAPFKSVSPPLSESELTACEESAALLQRCPLLLDLDVSAMAVQFNKVGLFAHSLACLLLIPGVSDRNKRVKTLLETGCAVSILDQVAEQNKRGRTLTRSDVIQHEVYGYIEETRSYQVLLATNHFESFVQHLVNTKNINGLLMTTLKADRLEKAMQLVGLFHKIHMESPSARFAIDNSLPAFEELWAYLDINGLLEEAMPYLPQPEPDADASEHTEEHEQDCTDIRSDPYGWIEPTGQPHSVLQESAHIMFAGDCSAEFPI